MREDALFNIVFWGHNKIRSSFSLSITYTKNYEEMNRLTD